MINFSLFEWKFPKPEVPPIIQNTVRSSGIRWINHYLCAQFHVHLIAKQDHLGQPALPERPHSATSLIIFGLIYTTSNFNVSNGDQLTSFKATLWDFYPHLAVKNYMTMQWILVSDPLNSDFVLTPTVANIVKCRLVIVRCHSVKNIYIIQ